MGLGLRMRRRRLRQKVRPGDEGAGLEGGCQQPLEARFLTCVLAPPDCAGGPMFTTSSMHTEKQWLFCVTLS